MLRHGYMLRALLCISAFFPFAPLLTSATQGNPRSTAIRAVAKANNLELEEIETDTKNPTEEFLKANPLHKIPTFVGSDGFVLTECIAIAIYGKCDLRRRQLLCACLPRSSRWPPGLSGPWQ